MARGSETHGAAGRHGDSRPPSTEDRIAPTLSWSSLRDIPPVVFHRAHLVRTVAVALVVGTILFAINQLDVVLSGRATTATWIKGAATYLVPFLVANYGLLTASRARRTYKAPLESTSEPSPPSRDG